MLDLADTEEKALPQTVESSTIKVDTSAVVPEAEVAATIKLDGKILVMEDVEKMKKQIVDLGLVAEEREKHITEVSLAACVLAPCRIQIVVYFLAEWKMLS